MGGGKERGEGDVIWMGEGAMEGREERGGRRRKKIDWRTEKGEGKREKKEEKTRREGKGDEKRERAKC